MNKYNWSRLFHSSRITLSKTKQQKIKRGPKRLEKFLKIQQMVMERWLPAARGNLKRQRSGLGSKKWAKTHRRKVKLRKPVYATRTQLRKLKKIIPRGYVKKTMGHPKLEW